MSKFILGWQIAVCILILLSLALGVIAIGLCICSVCSRSASYLLIALTLLASIPIIITICKHYFAAFTAIIADALFFVTAQRVDSRFVRGLVGTYAVISIQ